MSSDSHREKYNKRRRDEQLIQLALEDKAASMSELNEFHRRCKLWYDLYTGLYTRDYQGFRNSASIPFLYSVVQSDVARKVDMSFGHFPFIGFDSFAPEFEAIAKKNELLVSIQLEDLRAYSKAVDFYTTADLYGFAVTRECYRVDRRKTKIRVPELVAPGMTRDRFKTQWLTYFDGPDLDVLDPLDCFPQPGFRYIQDMGHFSYQYWMELDDMMEQAKADIEAGDEPMFDMAALEEVERNGMDGSSESQMRERVGYARNASEFANRGRRFRKPVEILERWGTVPSELVPAGEDRSRRLVILNGKVVGRYAANPYHHGQLPFGHFSVGDPHYFQGLGKTQLLSKLQATSNRLLNHKLDTLDLSISPAILVAAESGLDSSRPLNMTPGKVIQLERTTIGDDVIRPMPVNLNGVDRVEGSINELWRYMQMGSGIIEDTVSGGGGDEEQTAFEYRGRQEGAMTRLRMESRLSEEMWLEPTCNRIRAMNRQYLSVPKQIQMMGSLAIKDPVTGESVVETTIGYQDLWPDFKARAFGANQNMLRNETWDGMIQMAQVAGGIPEMMQSINWGNFAREALQLRGFRNVNKLIREFPFVNEAAEVLENSPGPGGAQTAAANSPQALNLDLASNPGNDML